MDNSIIIKIIREINYPSSHVLRFWMGARGNIYCDTVYNPRFARSEMRDSLRGTQGGGVSFGCVLSPGRLGTGN